MTLGEWVETGDNMLSHITTAMLCQQLRIVERQLREMDLDEIYEVPTWGVVAKREIDRFRSTREEQ